MYRHKNSRPVTLVLALAALLSGVMVAVVGDEARAGVNLYVSGSGDDGNDCLSPAAPCSTVNGAIFKAAAGDTVLVEEGTYTDPGSAVAQVIRDVTLSGGWDPTFTSRTGTSTLDGELSRPGVDVNGVITATVEHFDVVNGGWRAAISNRDGFLTLNSVAVVDASNEGIFTGFGTLVLNSSSVEGSTSVGVLSFCSTLELHDSEVLGNTSHGIETRCQTNPETNAATLDGSVVAGNDAIGLYIADGGMPATVTITESLFVDNGLGITNAAGDLTVSHTSVFGNRSEGLRNLQGLMVINNSTISRNGLATGHLGGGIYNNGDLVVNNSTITENAASSGGGLYHQSNPGFSSVTLQNTIVAGNSATSGSDCWSFDPFGSGGYNLIGSTSSCGFTPSVGDLVGLDPLLGPLADNGGTTPTHRPLLGSPVIDAGNPGAPGTGGGTCEALDQRGVARPEGVACDIGAFEQIIDGSITGTIYDEMLTPVPMGRVDVFDDSGTYVGSVDADGTGFYDTGGLVAGTYWILLYNGDDEFFIGFFPEWYDDAPLYRTDIAILVEVIDGVVSGVDAELLPLFDDMWDTVFTEDIIWMQAIGASKGCGSNLYCVDDPVPREIMADQMAKALLLPPVPDGWDPFTDDDGNPYEDSIERVAQAGITFGCNPPANDLYCPDRILNRGEMAAFFVRALDLTDDGGGDLFVDDDDSVFKDDADKMKAAGISFGCNPPTNDMYCPEDELTRGQIAAFIHRALRGVLWPDQADPTGNGPTTAGPLLRPQLDNLGWHS